MSLQKNPGAVRRYARLMKFAAWLQNLPNRLTPPPFRLLQIGAAFWQSRALYVATRLDIATVLGDATLSAEQIAAQVVAQPDAVARLLRLLAAIGVFEETAPRQFRNNATSAPLRADHPHGMRAMILMHNDPVMSRPWYEQLEQGVRSGTPPFELTHGAELFRWMEQHGDFDALFAAAMDSVEALTGDSFATDFDWSRFARVIDVGGSRGAKAIAILRRHPHLTALVIDRPGVMAGAADHWRGRADAALLARLQFQSGDLFAPLPAADGPKDIYFLAAVLHGLDDVAAARVLRNVAVASGSTGARIALFEMVLPERGTDLTGASFDMQMFMGTRGRERTLAEWQAVCAAGGVVLEEVVALQAPAQILVLRPQAV